VDVNNILVVLPEEIVGYTELKYVYIFVYNKVFVYEVQFVFECIY